ncbi:glutathione S-transferase family protein [Ramlibacter alkalitolerans]|uniref:Glutathione S-transferase N-terminal domain-containing protein n=1 Tax=Ramlibacter alkalitolerans TaxID=2039631 RepID=A0ABS1JMT2_9BURK|nr:glutathione S-transferase N-terminal domain-containing protein [Ramlibacter alkalitolerans]MBL0425542.1 glutathione S-transferase N-terminal domain-containing protein [Ramlibacter alkalitolerans]
MSLKLYFAPGACSFVPHSLLEAAGAAFEPLMVKLHKGEQNEAPFRSVNVRGQVPVLVDGDEVITQILAIVQYLDAKFPEQQFLPRETLARTRVLETLAWMNNTVHPTFTHVFMPHKFAGTPETQAELKTFNAKVYAGYLGEIETMARAAAGRGQPWLGGEHFGPLDAYALTLLRWGGFAQIDPTRHEALWAHVQKVAQQPGVARAIERERLQLNLFKAA